MDQFPSNSRSRIEREEKPAPSVEENEPKLDKVVAGKVVRRKKPLGRRFMETFFSGDSTSVVGYLGREVLLPALQDMVTDFVKQGIEKAVYGEVRSVRSNRHSTGPRTHISYDRPGTSIVRSPSSTTPITRKPVTQPSAFDVGEVILGSKIDAEMVAEKLYETAEQYGCVRVADLNDLIGQTSQYTDHKWGWTDLSQMTVKRVREGFLLVLPEPEDLR